MCGPFNCGRGTGRVRTREHGRDEAPDRAEAKRRREAQLLQDHPACRKLRKPCRLELVKQPTCTGAAASFEVFERRHKRQRLRLRLLDPRAETVEQVPVHDTKEVCGSER